MSALKKCIIVFSFLFTTFNLEADIFGDMLKELNKVAEDMNTQIETNNKNSGITNSEWQRYVPGNDTRISVGAPMRCPNWDSPQFIEHEEARKKYRVYERWFKDCSSYYPNARPVPETTFEQCLSMFNQEICSAREQLRQLRALREEAIIDYFASIANIAEAIGLKENAAGLRATLEYLDSEGLQGTKEYEEGFEIAYGQTVDLIGDIKNTLSNDYVPSSNEILLIESAAKLKNTAGMKWVNTVKERDKLIQQGGLAGSIESFTAGIDDFAFAGLARDVDITLNEYNNTISKNTGNVLDINDAEYEKEFASMEF